MACATKAENGNVGHTLRRQANSNEPQHLSGERAVHRVRQGDSYVHTERIDRDGRSLLRSEVPSGDDAPDHLEESNEEDDETPSLAGKNDPDMPSDFPIGARNENVWDLQPDGASHPTPYPTFDIKKLQGYDTLNPHGSTDPFQEVIDPRQIPGAEQIMKNMDLERQNPAAAHDQAMQHLEDVARGLSSRRWGGPDAGNGGDIKDGDAETTQDDQQTATGDDGGGDKATGEGVPHPLKDTVSIQKPLTSDTSSAEFNKGMNGAPLHHLKSNLDPVHVKAVISPTISSL